MAIVEALKKTGGDTKTEKLIPTMEGMSFDTPKGKMTFRKEDHQAMQSMYHFKIKVDPALPGACPSWCARSSRKMDVPIATSADSAAALPATPLARHLRSS
jgi:branched-chain amino acid transport system substrate-binding protein